MEGDVRLDRPTMSRIAPAGFNEEHKEAGQKDVFGRDLKNAPTFFKSQEPPIASVNVTVNTKANQLTVTSIAVEETLQVPNLDAVKIASRSTNHKRGLAVYKDPLSVD